MNELDQARAAHGVQTAPGGARSERVMKMFTDQDRANIIKSTTRTVRIGSGPEARDVIVRPLSASQVVASYALIRDILMPLLNLYTPNANGEKKSISLIDVINALGSNFDKVPQLMYQILKRGNDISESWIAEQMDIIIDMQLIIPIFLEQNGLGKLLGNDQPLAPTSKTASESAESPQQTVESQGS